MRAPRKRILAIAGVLLLSLYMVGYVLARNGRLIVHRSSVAGDRYSSHAVVGGDGLLGGAAINGIVAFVFTPLRYVELAYWHIRQPLDSPLSEAERRSRVP